MSITLLEECLGDCKYGMCEPVGLGDMSLQNKLSPIFITGCPRSGTTMLASQLANAETAIALPEMQYIYPLLHHVSDGGERDARAYHTLLADFRFQVSDIRISENELVTALAKDGGTGAVAKLIEAYAERHGIVLDTQRDIHWIEHAPDSRNKISIIRQAYPQARFVHIVRDPRSTYLSMLKLKRWNIWDPFKFARIWSDAVGRCYRLSATCPELVIEVRYEDILADPETEIAKLCDFLGLNFQTEMLNGGAVRLPGFTQGQHALTRSGVQKDKIDGWKKHIDARDADIIEAELCDWMIHYNYIDNVRELQSATGREKLKFAVRGALKTPGAKWRDARVRAHAAKAFAKTI